MIWLIVLAVLLFVVLLTVGWLIGFYNTGINARNDIRNMFSNICTEYQRRVDLFLNLAEVVKGSAKFEKSTLKEVIEARNILKGANVSTKDGMSAMKTIDMSSVALMSSFNRVNEAYPKLESTANYSKFMDEIRITEDRINIARTDYNGIVRDFNVYITEFPGVMVSGKMGFKEELFFETDKKNHDAPILKMDI